MKPIKIGIIGTGSISRSHMQAYQSNPTAELYALCDLNRERVLQAGKEFGVPPERCFTQKEDLLALAEIQAVSVCTWNSAHAECSIAALEAGKHVLCEKPMAINAQQAIQMQQTAERAGKLLMIGFVRRFGNDCEILQDYLHSGFFGDLYYAKASYLRRKGNPGGWFGDTSRSGGGPLIDLGVHVIDLVRYLMGNPTPVSVYGATFEKLGDRRGIKGNAGYVSAEHNAQDICDVEDLASAMIRFDNGAVLSVEASFSLNLKKERGTIELFGTKAGAKLDPELELYAELNGYMVDINLAHETALCFDGLFEQEINHYLACIQGTTPCRAPAEDGVAMMRILDAIYESARTGHEVVLA